MPRESRRRSPESSRHKKKKDKERRSSRERERRSKRKSEAEKEQEPEPEPELEIVPEPEEEIQVDVENDYEPTTRRSMPGAMPGALPEDDEPRQADTPRSQGDSQTRSYPPYQSPYDPRPEHSYGAAHSYYNTTDYPQQQEYRPAQQQYPPNTYQESVAQSPYQSPYASRPPRQSRFQQPQNQTYNNNDNNQPSYYGDAADSNAFPVMGETSDTSSTSSSLLNISRNSPPTTRYGNAFNTFFRAPSENRQSRTRSTRKFRRRRAKSSSLLPFGNSSSSSLDSDMAYGRGYIPREKDLRGASGTTRVTPGANDYQQRQQSSRRARLGAESAAGPSGGPHRSKTDEEIMDIGRQLTDIARAQNDADLRGSGGKNRSSKLFGAAGAASAAAALGAGAFYKSRRNDDQKKRGVGGSKPHAGEESEWESASDEDDSTSSSEDGDPELAYGSVVNASGRPATQGQPGQRNSMVDPRFFGPQNSLHGMVTPIPFHDPEAPGHRQNQPARQDKQTSSTRPEEGPMRRVYPVPTSDPNAFDFDGGSVLSSRQGLPQNSRPAPMPIQQPVPVTPVTSKVYDADRFRDEDRHRNGRPTRSKSDGAALAGVAAAGAAAAAAGAAMMHSNRKDSRDHRRDDEPWYASGRPDARDREQRDRDGYRESYRDEQVRNTNDRDFREPSRERDAYDPGLKRRHTAPVEPRTGENISYRLPRGEEIQVEFDPQRERDDRHRGYDRGETYNDLPRDNQKQLARDDRTGYAAGERPSSFRDDRQLVQTTDAPPTKTVVDPFQYQVDEFPKPSDGAPPRPVTPQVYTVDREPNFDDPPARAPSGADTRLSRKDSFEIEQQLESRQRDGSRIRDKTPQPQRRPMYEEDEHAASSMWDEAKHATVPVAAAAMASAIAVEAARSRERRRDDYDEYGSRRRSTAERDAVQEEADRYYRETVVARKIAEDEIRSRSASPNHDSRSVVRKYDEPEEPKVVIVTPPEMDDEQHPEKNGPYAAPNADVRIDNTIDPSGLSRFRSSGEELETGEIPAWRARDPSCERDRPLLNLVTPTPITTPRATPTPEQQARSAEPESSRHSEDSRDKKKKKKKKRSSVADVVIGPKGDVVQSPSTPKSVSWGENETKSYEPESPEPTRSEEGDRSRKSRPSVSKSGGWGAIAAAIAGGAAMSGDKEEDSSSRSRGFDEPETDLPPVPGPKPASPDAQKSDMPGSFGDDNEFAAVLAAGLQDTGFDPNIVIDDPTYRRRDSPPGANEGFYQQPMAETVTDLGIYEEAARAATGADTGFVLGEVAETPDGETDPAQDDWASSSKLSKKERKKREKASKRQSREGTETPDSIATPASEGIVVEEEEPLENLSKKERKKREKAAAAAAALDAGANDIYEPQESSRDPSGYEPVSRQPVEPEEDDWASTSSKKKKKKNRQSTDFTEEEGEKRTTPPVDAFDYLDSTRDAPPAADEWDAPRKKKKSKRKSGSSFVDADDYTDAKEGDPPDRGRHPFIEDNDVTSVTSDPASKRDRSERRFNGSRFEDDNRSVTSFASVPEGKKKGNKESKRSSGSFFGLFGRNGSDSKGKSSERDEQSFLGNAGTLGAGVGMAGAAAALGYAAARHNATDAPADQERMDDEQIRRSSPGFTDPEIVERTIKPAIDPQYGDLLPLPPSEPSSPIRDWEEDEADLPALPDSRPETPPEERNRLRQRPVVHSRRRSAVETPTKSPSHTAIPIQLRLGQRSNPSSPALNRSSPTASPVAPTTPTTADLSTSRRPTRPTSWDSSREIKPLYLLETSRQSQPEITELPELPPSEPPSSRESPAPSVHGGDAPKVEAAGSQESTPKAGARSAGFEDVPLPSSTSHVDSGTLERMVPDDDLTELPPLPRSVLPSPGFDQEGDPPAVEPMSKDRSSYLLHSTPPSVKKGSMPTPEDSSMPYEHTPTKQSQTFAEVEEYKDRDWGKYGLAAGALAGGIAAVSAWNKPNATDEVDPRDKPTDSIERGLDQGDQGDEWGSVSVSSSKKKKGKKGKKANEETLDEPSPAAVSAPEEMPAVESQMPEPLPQVEEPALQPPADETFEPKLSKKAKKKAKKSQTLGDWPDEKVEELIAAEPEQFPVDAQSQEVETENASRDLPAEAAAAPEDFIAPSKKSKKKKKGKQTPQWTEEEPATEHSTEKAPLSIATDDSPTISQAEESQPPLDTPSFHSEESRDDVDSIKWEDAHDTQPTEWSQVEASRSLGIGDGKPHEGSIRDDASDVFFDADEQARAPTPDEWARAEQEKAEGEGEMTPKVSPQLSRTQPEDLSLATSGATEEDQPPDADARDEPSWAAPTKKSKKKKGKKGHSADQEEPEPAQTTQEDPWTSTPPADIATETTSSGDLPAERASADVIPEDDAPGSTEHTWSSTPSKMTKKQKKSKKAMSVDEPDLGQATPTEDTAPDATWGSSTEQARGFAVEETAPPAEAPNEDNGFAPAEAGKKKKKKNRKSVTFDFDQADPTSTSQDAKAEEHRDLSSEARTAGGGVLAGALAATAGALAAGAGPGNDADEATGESAQSSSSDKWFGDLQGADAQPVDPTHTDSAPAASDPQELSDPVLGSDKPSELEASQDRSLHDAGNKEPEFDALKANDHTMAVPESTPAQPDDEWEATTTSKKGKKDKKNKKKQQQQQKDLSWADEPPPVESSEPPVQTEDLAVAGEGESGEIPPEGPVAAEDIAAPGQTDEPAKEEDAYFEPASTGKKSKKDKKKKKATAFSWDDEPEATSVATPGVEEPSVEDAAPAPATEDSAATTSSQPEVAAPEDEWAAASTGKKSKKDKKKKAAALSWPDETESALASEEPPSAPAADNVAEAALATAETEAAALENDEWAASPSTKKSKKDKKKRASSAFAWSEEPEPVPAVEEPSPAPVDQAEAIPSTPQPETTAAEDEWAATPSTKKSKKDKKKKASAFSWDDEPAPAVEEPAAQPWEGETAAQIEENDPAPDTSTQLEATAPEDEWAAAPTGKKSKKDKKKKALAFSRDDEPTPAADESAGPTPQEEPAQIPPTQPEVTVPEDDWAATPTTKKSKKDKKKKASAFAWDDEPVATAEDSAPAVEPPVEDAAPTTTTTTTAAAAAAEPKPEDEWAAAPAGKKSKKDKKKNKTAAFSWDEPAADPEQKPVEEQPAAETAETSPQEEDLSRGLAAAATTAAGAAAIATAVAADAGEDEWSAPSGKKSRKDKKKQKNAAWDDVEPEPAAEAGPNTADNMLAKTTPETALNAEDNIAAVPTETSNVTVPAPAGEDEWAASTSKKSKKDKKKQKKAAASSWDEPEPEPEPAPTVEEEQKPVDEPVTEQMDVGSVQTQEDSVMPAEVTDSAPGGDVAEDDWATPTSKKSKKDKKKQKKAATFSWDEPDSEAQSKSIEEAPAAVPQEDAPTETPQQPETAVEAAGDEEWATPTTGKKGKKNKKKKDASAFDWGEPEPSQTPANEPQLAGESVQPSAKLEEVASAQEDTSLPADESKPEDQISAPAPVEAGEDEWASSFVSKKSKKDKKKKKQTGLFEADEPTTEPAEPSPALVSADVDVATITPSADPSQEGGEDVSKSEEMSFEMSGSKKSKKKKKQQALFSSLDDPPTEAPAEEETFQDASMEPIKGEPAASDFDFQPAGKKGKKNKKKAQSPTFDDFYDAPEEPGKVEPSADAQVETAVVPEDGARSLDVGAGPAQAAEGEVDGGFAKEDVSLERTADGAGKVFDQLAATDDNALDNQEPIVKSDKAAQEPEPLPKSTIVETEETNQPSLDEEFPLTTKKSKKDKKKKKAAATAASAFDKTPDTTPAPEFQTELDLGSADATIPQDLSQTQEREAPATTESSDKPGIPAPALEEEDFGFVSKLSKKDKKKKKKQAAGLGEPDLTAEAEPSVSVDAPVDVPVAPEDSSAQEQTYNQPPEFSEQPPSEQPIAPAEDDFSSAPLSKKDKKKKKKGLLAAATTAGLAAATVAGVSAADESSESVTNAETTQVEQSSQPPVDEPSQLQDAVGGEDLAQEKAEESAPADSKTAEPEAPADADDGFGFVSKKSKKDKKKKKASALDFLEGETQKPQDEAPAPSPAPMSWADEVEESFPEPVPETARDISSTEDPAPDAYLPSSIREAEVEKPAAEEEWGFSPAKKSKKDKKKKKSKTADESQPASGTATPLPVDEPQTTAAPEEAKLAENLQLTQEEPSASEPALTSTDQARGPDDQLADAQLDAAPASAEPAAVLEDEWGTASTKKAKKDKKKNKGKQVEEDAHKEAPGLAIPTSEEPTAADVPQDKEPIPSFDTKPQNDENVATSIPEQPISQEPSATDKWSADTFVTKKSKKDKKKKRASLFEPEPEPEPIPPSEDRVEAPELQQSPQVRDGDQGGALETAEGSSDLPAVQPAEETQGNNEEWPESTAKKGKKKKKGKTASTTEPEPVSVLEPEIVPEAESQPWTDPRDLVAEPELEATSAPDANVADSAPIMEEPIAAPEPTTTEQEPPAPDADEWSGFATKKSKKDKKKKSKGLLGSDEPEAPSAPTEEQPALDEPAPIQETPENIAPQAEPAPPPAEDEWADFSTKKSKKDKKKKTKALAFEEPAPAPEPAPMLEPEPSESAANDQPATDALPVEDPTPAAQEPETPASAPSEVPAEDLADFSTKKSKKDKKKKDKALAFYEPEASVAPIADESSIDAPLPAEEVALQDSPDVEAPAFAPPDDWTEPFTKKSKKDKKKKNKALAFDEAQPEPEPSRAPSQDEPLVDFPPTAEEATQELVEAEVPASAAVDDWAEFSTQKSKGAAFEEPEPTVVPLAESVGDIASPAQTATLEATEPEAPAAPPGVVDDWADFSTKKSRKDKKKKNKDLVSDEPKSVPEPVSPAAQIEPTNNPPEEPSPPDVSVAEPEPGQEASAPAAEDDWAGFTSKKSKKDKKKKKRDSLAWDEPEPAAEPTTIPVPTPADAESANYGQDLDISDTLPKDKIIGEPSQTTENPFMEEAVVTEETPAVSIESEAQIPAEDPAEFFTAKKSKKDKKKKRNSQAWFEEEPVPAPEDSADASRSIEAPMQEEQPRQQQEVPTADSITESATDVQETTAQPVEDPFAADFSTKKSKKDKKKAKKQQAFAMNWNTPTPNDPASAEPPSAAEEPAVLEPSVAPPEVQDEPVASQATEEDQDIPTETIPAEQRDAEPFPQEEAIPVEPAADDEWGLAAPKKKKKGKKGKATASAAASEPASRAESPVRDVMADTTVEPEAQPAAEVEAPTAFEAQSSAPMDEPAADDRWGFSTKKKKGKKSKSVFVAPEPEPTLEAEPAPRAVSPTGDQNVPTNADTGDMAAVDEPSTAATETVSVPADTAPEDSWGFAPTKKSKKDKKRAKAASLASRELSPNREEAPAEVVQDVTTATERVIDQEPSTTEQPSGFVDDAWKESVSTKKTKKGKKKGKNASIYDFEEPTPAKSETNEESAAPPSKDDSTPWGAVGAAALAGAAATAAFSGSNDKNDGEDNMNDLAYGDAAKYSPSQEESREIAAAYFEGERSQQHPEQMTSKSVDYVPTTIQDQVEVSNPLGITTDREVISEKPASNSFDDVWGDDSRGADQDSGMMDDVWGDDTRGNDEPSNLDIWGEDTRGNEQASGMMDDVWGEDTRDNTAPSNIMDDVWGESPLPDSPAAKNIAASYLEHPRDVRTKEPKETEEDKKVTSPTSSTISKAGKAAAAGAAAGGVAAVASKLGGTGAGPKKKKKGKKSKYEGKMPGGGDDLFDDPVLWEGADKKHVSEAASYEVEKFWGPSAEEEESKEMGGEPAVEDQKSVEENEPEGASSKAQLTEEQPATEPTPQEQKPVDEGEAATRKVHRVEEMKESTSDVDAESPVLGRDLSEQPVRQSIESGPDYEPSQRGLDSAADDGFSWAASNVEPHIDLRRSLSRGLPPVQEETYEDEEVQSKARGFMEPPKTPEPNRDSGFAGESPSSHRPARRSHLAESEYRDSGVHMREQVRTPEPSSLATPHYPQQKRSLRRSPLSKGDLRDESFGSSTPILREPSPRGATPEPQKTSTRQQQAKAPIGTPLGHEGPLSRYGDLSSSSRAATPSASGRRSVSDQLTRTDSPGPGVGPSPPDAAANRAIRRSASNTSLSRQKTPEPLNLRAGSPASGIFRQGSATPPLRRADRRVSGDLRSLSQRSEVDLTASGGTTGGTTAAAAAGVGAAGLAAAGAAALAASTTSRSSSGGKNDEGDLSLSKDKQRKHSDDNKDTTATASRSTPVANEGRVRSKDMPEVFDGVGEGRIGSPRSPTRPHSMRRRQSMQVLELESRLEQLTAENRQLAEAKEQAEANQNQRASSILAERDAEIEQLKQSVAFFQKEIARLSEVNDGLNSANAQLATQRDDRFHMLETQHHETSRQLEESRTSFGGFQTSLGEKDAEIERLRTELEQAKEQIRDMQRQILESKAGDSDFLNIQDVDHFDHRCQQLCSHVQQWVLRFSKFSDMRASRLTSEINDEKVIDRLDNSVLDGSDVDNYLADRVKRRDIFMSMTMNMIWEFVFTRYLFGMDREQRQKLKSLEKLLTEVGPPQAVRQWRAVTLTLLARRSSFQAQRDQDTEAVVQAIFHTLSKVLPPPSNLEEQSLSQLRRVMREAVDLAIEMRTQRAEYMMLPPLQPTYDENGELAETVPFNASLMNERSGDASISNEDLETQGSRVRVVLFPLVVKKGDDTGSGNDEIVVCPAQVLVQRQNEKRRSMSGGVGRLMTPSSDAGGASLGVQSVLNKSDISMRTEGTYNYPRTPEDDY